MRQLIKKTHIHITLSFLGLFLCNFCSTLAQSPYFSLQHYTAKDVLPNDICYGMYQDAKGYIWLGTDDGLVKFDGLDFEHFSAKDGLSNNFVINIHASNPDTLLLATWGGGINYLVNGKFSNHPAFPESWKFSNIFARGSSLVAWNRIDAMWHLPQQANALQDTIACLLINPAEEKKLLLGATAKTGNPNYKRNLTQYALVGNEQLIFFGGDIKGIWTYLDQDKFEPSYSETAQEVISAAHEDQDQTTWFAGTGIIYKYHQNKFIANYRKGLPQEKIISIKSYNAHQVVLLTQHPQINQRHLYLYDLVTGRIRNLTTEFTIEGFPAYILVDNSGSIWLSTDGQGIYQLKKSPFLTINEEEGLNNTFVLGINEDAQGRVWIGTKQGLYFLENNQIKTLASPNPFENKEIEFIKTLSNGQLVFDDNTRGTYLIRDKQIQRISFPYNNQDMAILPNGQALTLSANRVLFTLAQADSATLSPYFNIVEEYNFPASLTPKRLVQIEGDEFWLATTQGLIKYKHQTNAFLDTINQADGLIHQQINDVILLEDGEKWIATEGGLCFQSKQGIQCFDKDDGLISNKCRMLLLDRDGRVWIGTPRGLSCFDKGNFYAFNQSNGLCSNHVNCLFLDAQNQLWVGSQGISVFSLTDSTFIKPAPQISLKNIVVNDQPQPADSLNNSFDYQSSLLFNFSCLTQSKADNLLLQYQYKEQGWKTLRERSFELLNATDGDYELFFRAKSLDSPWSEVYRLNFTVHPPIWRTWYAYSLYGFILSITVLWLSRYFNRRQQAKNAQALERLELAKLKELNDFKSRFFDNISHEFRTPLTLILGTINNLLKSPREEDKANLLVSKRNAGVLLELINQLLTLSKLESGGLNLNLTATDLIAELSQLHENFLPFAHQKGVHLKLHTSHHQLVFDFDPTKLRIVVSNLLANALKFTPSGGEVVLAVETDQDSQISFTVSDTGVGIAQADLAFIFDRFHQASNTASKNYAGTGIGLSLSKEIVTLHEGKLLVSSQEGVGTTFTVKLPFRKPSTPPLASEIPTAPHQITLNGLPAPSSDQSSKLPKLLIVEDHTDMAWYIHSILSAHYLITLAKNGKEGLKQAFSIEPDLIISDVMMPEMNGMELCKALKTDTRTSHIPVILLTAKTGQKNKLDGLRLGADEYLTKPFNEEELQLRIQNLLKKRAETHEKFIKKIEVAPSEITVTSADEEFIKQVVILVEENMDNPQFNVAELVKGVGMSRTLLHNKLKALTGQSSSEFIRTLRLKRAAQLIVQQNGNISDICYQVGFGSLSYFSSSFSKLYGQSPSEYLANQSSTIKDS